MGGVGLWAHGKGSSGSTVDTCASHEVAEAACSLLHYLLSALLALFPLCCNIHMALETEKTISPYANDKLFYQNLSGGYLTREFFWRDHYTWLQEQGYTLRPRYHPDWTPSWTGTKKDSDYCEDGQISNVCPPCLRLGSLRPHANERNTLETWDHGCDPHFRRPRGCAQESE